MIPTCQIITGDALTELPKLSARTCLVAGNCLQMHFPGCVKHFHVFPQQRRSAIFPSVAAPNGPKAEFPTDLVWFNRFHFFIFLFVSFFSSRCRRSHLTLVGDRRASVQRNVRAVASRFARRFRSAPLIVLGFPLAILPNA